jgi:hypothetical protein
MKILKKKEPIFHKVGMKNQNKLIIRCDHVNLLNQSLYPKLENVQLGLKLLYQNKKDSKLQVAPSEKANSPKDSPAM